MINGKSRSFGSSNIGCACGKTRLIVSGPPIIVTECLCDSCRKAAARVTALPGALDMRTPYGGTPTALYRKDRVLFASGADQLMEFRLTSDAGTRRVVAACCNTPVFMEMKGAHWIDLYLHLWPDLARPRIDLRTMVADLPDPGTLPNNVPNRRHQSITFYAKLLRAWIAMGFRTPQVTVSGRIDV